MLFLTQFRFELQKMFSRKRTYVGFVIFLLMEFLILNMMNLPHIKEQFRRMIEQNGYGFDDYFSGYTLAMQIVMLTVNLLGSLYLALVAGDVMSKEIEEGTMRMLLCRPVSRVRVALLKYFASVTYTFALIVFISLTALAAGLLYRGPGGLFLGPPEAAFTLVPKESALRLYLLSIPLLALARVSISSIGFLFSCCNMKPATASIVTLSVIFLDFILHGVDYFASLRQYFITTHLGAWQILFQPHPIWGRMIEDYSYLIGLDITCLIVGTAFFLQRDLK
jgi:ABC-2 type transport system permease protein